MIQQVREATFRSAELLVGVISGTLSNKSLYTNICTIQV